jgi:hypothetical protein
MIRPVFIAVSLFLATASLAQADVVSIIDSYDAPNTEQGVLRPIRGMSMAQVEQKFGQAEETSPAVGEPPITVWSYPDFKVYFEHNLVIYSVVKQK